MPQGEHNHNGSEGAGNDIDQVDISFAIDSAWGLTEGAIAIHRISVTETRSRMKDQFMKNDKALLEFPYEHSQNNKIRSRSSSFNDSPDNGPGC